MTTTQTSKSDLEQRLDHLAFDKTIPFCEHCRIQAPLGKCDQCGSDDLSRDLAGERGWGVDWVIASLLRDNLTPVNVEEAFEESIRESYPETTKIGWLEMDTVDVLKEVDSISWRCARGDWESFEESDERIFSLDGGCTYYWKVTDLQDLDDDNFDNVMSALNYLRAVK
jgi:hypothetical protein